MIATACLSLSAGASAQEAHAPGARASVFISPSGEPFHAKAGEPDPVDVWFNQADADHDGALSLAEFQADAVRFFKLIDANHDGVIDGFELTAYEQKIAPEILPRVARLTARDIPPLPTGRQEGPGRNSTLEQSREGRRGDGGFAGPIVISLTHEPEPVAAADGDFDGKITQAEMAAAAKRRFQALDTDHDGRLMRAELPKTSAERAKEKADRKRNGPTH